MSALYGTLTGDGRSAARMRCANTEITASARSYEGSVSVTLNRPTKRGLKREPGPEDITVTIEVGEGSRVGGREVWRGSLASLMLQGLLKDQGEDSLDAMPCVRAMGCLCAAHAKGRRSDGPCDAREDVRP